MEELSSFFDYAAEVGLTKHIGGLGSTEALVELCHINENTYVLDVGCGVGLTPCYIAKKYKCSIVGVDILEKMIERSNERAIQEELTDYVKFQVADAQDLPFEDNLFDVVITESVTAFPKDKQKAVNEYVRVTKPGGFVGLNESTWLKFPPPADLVAWVSQEIGTGVSPLSSPEWTALLENAGLHGITSNTFSIDVKAESKGILQRYGFLGLMKSIGRMLKLYTKNSTYRDFVKKVKSEGITPKNLEEYFGYGLFIGQK